MVRTSLLAVGVVALASAVVAAQDATPKETFRVTTDSCRLGRTGRADYGSLAQACGVAASLRPGATAYVAVFPAAEAEKAFASAPLAYRVCVRQCRGGWSVLETLTDGVKAKARADDLRKFGTLVEVVSDYTVKEVFHVIAGSCSRSMRLQGSFVSAQAAIEAAQACRARGLTRCHVDVGTTGERDPAARLVRYRVYTQPRRPVWVLQLTTTNPIKAQELAGSTGMIVREFAGS
jgi:hypothetical protein